MHYLFIYQWMSSTHSLDTFKFSVSTLSDFTCSLKGLMGAHKHIIVQRREGSVAQFCMSIVSTFASLYAISMCLQAGRRTWETQTSGSQGIHANYLAIETPPPPVVLPYMKFPRRLEYANLNWMLEVENCRLRHPNQDPNMSVWRLGNKTVLVASIFPCLQ